MRSRESFTSPSGLGGLARRGLLVPIVLLTVALLALSAGRADAALPGPYVKLTVALTAFKGADGSITGQATFSSREPKCAARAPSRAFHTALGHFMGLGAPDVLGSPGVAAPDFDLAPFSLGVLQVVVPPDQTLRDDNGRTALASQATFAIINVHVGQFRVKTSTTHRRVTCRFRPAPHRDIAAGIFPL